MSVIRKMLTATICTLFLGSCTNFSERAHYYLTDKETFAETRVARIVEAINKNDKETLIALFSDKALSNASNFDDKIDGLFEFMKYDIVSWKIRGVAESTSSSYGKRAVRHRYWVDLETDFESYKFFVIDYVFNEIDTENQGVYTLEVGLSEIPFGASWEEKEIIHPGVYVFENIENVVVDGIKYYLTMSELKIDAYFIDLNYSSKYDALWNLACRAPYLRKLVISGTNGATLTIDAVYSDRLSRLNNLVFLEIYDVVLDSISFLDGVESLEQLYISFTDTNLKGEISDI